MSNDRELLELAAKAAGLKIGHFVGDSARLSCPPHTDVGFWPWNPLKDDGDALRLAMNLRLAISCYEGAIYVDGDGLTITVKDLSDRHAATRRAIVSCAAEIGRAMQ